MIAVWFSCGAASAAMVRLYAGAAQQKARAREAQKGRK